MGERETMYSTTDTSYYYHTTASITTNGCEEYVKVIFWGGEVYLVPVEL